MLSEDNIFSHRSSTSSNSSNYSSSGSAGKGGQAEVEEEGEDMEMCQEGEDEEVEEVEHPDFLRAMKVNCKIGEEEDEGVEGEEQLSEDEWSLIEVNRQILISQLQLITISSPLFPLLRALNTTHIHNGSQCM